MHWFQYLDQPVTGRLLDGENGHLGLVAITDRPWDGFVSAVRKANLTVPPLVLEQAAKEPAPKADAAPAQEPAPEAAPAAEGDAPAAEAKP